MRRFSVVRHEWELGRRDVRDVRGEDVDPARYGEQRSEKVRSVNAARDATEAALIEEARARGTPVLAICRGIQILNVALGGTLVQDIPSQCETTIDHDDEGARNSRTHEVAIEPGSIIAKAIGTDHLSVNSFHHQSVKRVADGMRVTARSPDGVIEGIESTDDDWWVMAVQWHPEEMTDSAEPWDRGLFKAFAVRDGRLITGQQQYSGRKVAQMVIEALGVGR